MKTWVISDTHFGHRAICEFSDKHGNKLRPFANSDEMDEVLVDNWNSLVAPTDKIYHLGDVATTKKGLKVLSRLNGKKILIKGNHDMEKLSVYKEYFADVRSCKVIDGFIMTHIPIHECQIERFGKNIHGHMHEKKVMRLASDLVHAGYDEHNCDIFNTEYYELEDNRYINVCVEQTQYKPVLLDEIIHRFMSIDKFTEREVVEQTLAEILCK